MRAMPIEPFPRRYPVATYFLLTFLLSWLGAFLVATLSLARGHGISVSKTAGILLFPAMLLGPPTSGVLLTGITNGRAGLRSLFERLQKWRAAPQWYALLLLPPVLVLLVLSCFKLAVSPAFSPNHFYLGILFGLPAGIFEELGWMGYAYPKMIVRWSPLRSATVLGLLWSLWHLPAINFLGASAPHGAFWFPFFLAFTLAMTAMRVLICWQYSNTHSVLLAQFMHLSSTATLVIFSPRVSPAQEVMWYTVYGAILWTTVGVMARSNGRALRKTINVSLARSS